MKRIVFILVSLLCVIQLSAQTVLITGTVYDETGEPVIGCSINTSESRSTCSDLSGRYSIAVSQDKTVEIHFECIGYEDVVLTFSPESGASFNPDVKSGETQFGMGIKREDIVGFRTPFLDYNEYVYKALETLGFKYDATIEEGWQDNMDGSDFLWPYTLDEGSPGDAFVAKDMYERDEPFVKKHPGLWLLPEYVLIIPPDELCEKYGTKKGARKRAEEASGEDLEPGKITGMDWNIWFQYFMNKEDALATMKYSFDLRYDGNRCPFTFGMHTDIYSDKYDVYDLEGDEKDHIKANAAQRREAVVEFLEYISKKPDCRVTTADNVRKYLENPVAM